MWPHDEHVRAELSRHVSIIMLAVSVLALAVTLDVRGDERIALRWWPSFPAPETCLSRTWLHLDCPACGLTRSFVRLAAADVSGSFQKHRLGWLVALFVVGQIPFRLARLRTILRTGEVRSSALWPGRFTKGLVVVVLINWLLKLCGW